MRKLFTLIAATWFLLIGELQAQNITRMEYFINTDPGIGNGTVFITAAADSVSVTIPVSLNGLAPGNYLVGLRAMDAGGIWSHAEFRTLFILPLPDNSNQQITAGEYYFGDTDPGPGNATPFTITNPADSVTVLEDSVLSNLPQGVYKINIRFKDARGLWSHQETRNFSVCGTYGAQSEFTYQVEGNRVFFTNQSLYYDTVSWRFGDNSVDTVFNPVKSFANAGIYNVQLITGNSCAIDTLTQAIQISGLQRVNANKAGNAGISTLVFEGFGFTPTTDVKLVLGNQVFTPINRTVLNANRIRANFNLTGFAPGWYRAVAGVGGAFDTASNAVLIEQSKPVNLVLSTLNGRFLKRPGGVYSRGTIINQGSHDAIMVPYVFLGNVLPGVTPVNTSPFFETSPVFLQNEGVFQHTLQYIASNNIPAVVMEPANLDSARERQIVAYYKVKVPANASRTEAIRFRNDPSVAYSYQTGNVVLGPLLDSYAANDSINTTYQPCYSAFLKRAVERELNTVISDASWSPCFTIAFDTLMRTLANISQNPILEDFMVPMQAGFSALLAQMADCPGSGVPPGLGGIRFKRIIQHVTNNWIYLEDIDSMNTDCIDTTVRVFTGNANVGTIEKMNEQVQAPSGICQEQCAGATVFPEMCEQCLPLILAGKVGGKLKVKGHSWAANSGVVGCQEWCETTSVDPNAKYGPGNNTDRKFINHLKEVNYRVTFENLATATAPAAYVEIRDTIDKAIFDIRTLKLEDFSWGDSIVTAEPNKQNLSFLKNLKPAHPNFLRIDAATDTARGIVTWKFWTVDTVTLQLTESPTEGFLPPNTDGVRGTGYVSFSIAPWPSVQNGTAIKNKATIIFDQNPAILTDEWEYRIDTTTPSSSVNPLPVTQSATSIPVNWAGTDQHAGVQYYSIYVSVNDSMYKAWKSLTAETNGIYIGQIGKTYKFFSIALDKAGNFEDAPLNPIQNPDAVITLQAALPLTLVSFSADRSLDGTKANLYWVTADEKNVSHFNVQRSADGTNFITIGKENAKNSISGATYKWQDAQPAPGINYYRLQLVDADGSVKLSEVRVVNFDKKEEILVFPRITSDLVFIQSNKTLSAVLYNASGVKLGQQVIAGNGRLDMSALAAGVYFIRIEPGNKTYKIIKN